MNMKYRERMKRTESGIGGVEGAVVKIGIKCRG